MDGQNIVLLKNGSSTKGYNNKVASRSYFWQRPASKDLSIC